MKAGVEQPSGRVRQEKGGGVAEGVPVPVGEGEEVPVPVGEGEGVPEQVGVPLLVSVPVPVAEPVRLGVTVPVCVRVPDTVWDAVWVGVPVALTVAVGEFVGVPVRVTVSVLDWVGVGVEVQERTFAVEPGAHAAGQAHGEQEAAPAALNVEAGHWAQVELEGAPVAALAVPAGQSAGVADRAGQNLPAGQSTLAPVEQLNPAGQGLQITVSENPSAQLGLLVQASQVTAYSVGGQVHVSASNATRRPPPPRLKLKHVTYTVLLPGDRLNENCAVAR